MISNDQNALVQTLSTEDNTNDNSSGYEDLIGFSRHKEKDLLPKKQSSLLSNHPQIINREQEEHEILQPYFSSVVPSVIGDSLSLKEFWVTCLQMSSCNSNTLWRQVTQIKRDFVSSEGCQSLCVSQVLLHPSICYNLQHKVQLHRITGNVKVIAVPCETMDFSNYTLVQNIAKILANCWVRKGADAHSDHQQPCSSFHSISTSLSSISSSVHGKSVISAVSWVATKLLSKLDLMDDPEDAQDIKDCAALLEKDMNRLSIGTNPSPKSFVTLDDDLNKLEAVALVSVDLVCQCCQHIIEFLPRFWIAAESLQNLNFHSYYYKNTFRPKIFLSKREHQQEILSFWKFCQFVGTYTTRQHREETSSTDYFNLVAAVPHLLSNLAEHDSHLLFHLLSFFGRIQTNFSQQNICIDENLVLFKYSDDNNAEDGFHEVDAAIFQVTLAQWKIEERIAALDRQYIEWGKRALAYCSNKQKAINLLKQRKMVELQIEKDRQFFFKLEQTKLHLEQAYYTKVTLDALENSHHVLKNMKMNLENVEEIMLDLEEDMNYVGELSSVTAFSLISTNEHFLSDEADFDCSWLDLPLTTTAATTTSLIERQNQIQNNESAAFFSPRIENTVEADAASASNEKISEKHATPSCKISLSLSCAPKELQHQVEAACSENKSSPPNELVLDKA